MARRAKNNLLKILRESKGLTAEFIAKKLGVVKGNIWRAEVGKILSDKLAIRIAKALDVSSDIMFYNMGRIPPDKREYFKKDPLFFKELIDEACKDASKLVKTEHFMNNIMQQKNAITPDLQKLHSLIKSEK